MYNNPYLTGFNGFREQNQSQPIQNIFTNQIPSNSTFMARFLKDGETPQEAFVNTKTALISLSTKKLHIKEQDGSITTYDIVMPLDEKDLKIQSLEQEINNLKEMMNNVSATSTNEANITITESNDDVKKHGRK